MNITQLASYLAKQEGNKSQVKIGDIREVLAILSDAVVEKPEILELLVKNGERRAKRKAPAKKPGKKNQR